MDLTSQPEERLAMKKKKKSLTAWVVPDWRDDFKKDSHGWGDDKIMLPSTFLRKMTDFKKVRITIEEI
jgi:hypothetical protein